MCCLFWSPRSRDWAGCGLLAVHWAGCSRAYVSKPDAGKKCFVCVCASVGSCNGLAISFWCMPLELSWETRARVDFCHILLLERAWATLSLAMPMKLWDSAGRECGGTLLYLHAYIHTDHFLYRSIFILSGFFLMFFFAHPTRSISQVDKIILSKCVNLSAVTSLQSLIRFLGC